MTDLTPERVEEIKRLAEEAAASDCAAWVTDELDPATVIELCEAWERMQPVARSPENPICVNISCAWPAYPETDTCLGHMIECSERAFIKVPAFAREEWRRICHEIGFHTMLNAPGKPFTRADYKIEPEDTLEEALEGALEKIEGTLEKIFSPPVDHIIGLFAKTPDPENLKIKFAKTRPLLEPDDEQR